MLVIDDRPDLHVAIGRRRASSAFVGGLIVFPGGGVDPGDRSAGALQRVPRAHVPDLGEREAAAFLHAAVRETTEEVGLDIGGPGPLDPAAFPHVGNWVTPEGAPRRYDTHFFLARFRGGDLVADELELDMAWWERPADTLDRIERGDLEAITPTIAFLQALASHRFVDEAFASAASGRRSGWEFGWTDL